MRNPINKQDLVALREQISAAETIAISGHQHPDGDCVGSTLGLYNYLTSLYPDKKIDLYLEPIQEPFKFLANADKIRHEHTEEEKYDLYFSLDCSDTERLGFNENYYLETPYKVCIDHHITNQGFGDLRFIYPDMSSTSEILFYMLDEDKIDLAVAEALYMGIVHDTGVFKHTNTTRMTMEAAGALIEKGIQTEEIIDSTFYKKTYIQNQILGRALMESILMLDGRMIFSVVTQKDFKFYGIDGSDLDGIIDQLRITEGVECAVLLHETKEGDYKVSMRSNDLVNVSKIATFFGGGGHVKAAGCTCHGTWRDIVMNIAKMVESQLDGEAHAKVDA
ncbi:MAG: bifunctional oligoribonuclease/PAP phosphatase NrnA [Lachnospiraceae bacterium]|nr:bifunctional oligoribonuclease/PAP phosphatase NrnA [Lachnospiraceae bacterium]